MGQDRDEVEWFNNGKGCDVLGSANAPDLFGHYGSKQDESKPFIFSIIDNSATDGATLGAASDEVQGSGKRNCACKN